MKRMILGLLAAVLMLAGGPVSASAESGSTATDRDDAPAKIDITRFRVDNGAHWFRMKVDVRNLRQKGKFHFHYWMGTGGTPPPRSVQVIVRRVDNHTQARFLECGPEDCTPKPCARLRAAWRPGDDVVRIAAPQRCFPRPQHSPAAPPPASGRFFVWSQLGDAVDSPDATLTLDRG